MVEGLVNRISKWVVVYPFLVVASVVMVFPLIWTFSTSLKTAQTVTLREVQLIPDPIQWSNYITIFEEAPLLRYTQNTLIYGVRFGNRRHIDLRIGRLRVCPYSISSTGDSFLYLAEHHDAATCGADHSRVRDL